MSPHDASGVAHGGSGASGSNMRRKNASRETTAALKTWLYEHRKNPYPTKGEKIMLAIITKMSVSSTSKMNTGGWEADSISIRDFVMNVPSSGIFQKL